jgi:hypothetical protein
MKLQNGQTVHVGKEKHVYEIPDEKAKEIGLLKDKKADQPTKAEDKKS